jgi:mannose-6-phosphate isomerase class I
MQLQKFRWSRVYESSEEELLHFLATKNLTAERWAAGEFEDFKNKVAAKETTLYCAEGSLIFHGGTTISLQPGDALRIPAGTNYELTAGISGCVCYQS